MQHLSMGFIGGGNMATSLIHGLIQAHYPPDKIWVADPNLEKRQHLKTEYGVTVRENVSEILAGAEVVVLAAKPKEVKTLAAQLGSEFSKKSPLLISIAAGITTTLLHRWFGEKLAIVRAMPNTPALLRVGATGLYANSKVSEVQKEYAESILRSVGLTVWVNHEHDIDAVTALSGSGPAYFFLIMESLQQAAEKLGLPANTAKVLTLQTALGAARMALESDITLDSLIKRVASPGGTTEQALAILETGGIRELLENALGAAKNRAKEISEELG